MAKKKPTPTKVESIRHKDKRANIPTEELRDFVADEELSPKTLLYPRDPSLDPQLVWKGKDEQDREDLAVPVVPIYIQEKIQPQAIIDGLPRAEKPEDDTPNLFADFNGGPADFQQKVDFYHHEQNWTNRLILGDSLLVMTSLAEKERLKGRVQTIYLDPPYGIKFGSNWQVSTRKRDVKDGKAEDATRQPEQVRAFRDTWKLGIHSYLAYLRDRLVVARDLLTETGSVFVQIGDENVHLVRNVMDEVFGADNACALVSFAKTASLGSALLPASHDFLLWYAKDRNLVKYRQLFQPRRERTELGTFTWIEETGQQSRRMSRAELTGAAKMPHGRRFRAADLTRMMWSETLSYELEFQRRKYRPASTRRWATTFEGMKKLIVADRLIQQGQSLAYKLFDD
ncbi:MAG: DNA methyltransferase, partial [Pyrinomonadaceae bacterium]